MRRGALAFLVAANSALSTLYFALYFFVEPRGYSLVLGFLWAFAAFCWIMTLAVSK